MKKSIALVLAVLLVITCFAACNGKEGNSSSSVPSSKSEQSVVSQNEDSSDLGDTMENADDDFGNIDLSEHTDLVISVYGTTPADMQMINEMASKITEEKLNCTVELQIMANPTQQYALALSTGEPIDLIWTATWMNCWNYAKQGAFQDITDVVNEKFPVLKEMIGEDQWNSTSVGGRYYLIPANCRDEASNWSQWGVTWREDIRKQLNCEEIVDLETMEAYAKAVAESDLGMIPYFDNASGGLWHMMLEKEHIYTEFGGAANTLCLNIDTKEICDYTTLDSVKEFCEIQRRWEKNGYLQPDIASSTDTGPDGVLSGKYAGAIAGVTPATYVSNFVTPIKAAHPDWEMGYLNYGVMYGTTYENSAAMGGLAIPKVSKNTERALAFLELMMTDGELYNLFDIGVEGIHYEVDEDGFYSSLQGTSQTYPRSSTWVPRFYVNKEAKIYTADEQWAVEYISENMRPNAITNYWANCPFDFSEYSEYSTAVQNVMNQYWTPLLLGATDDIDGTLKTLQDQLELNGIDIVAESIEKQWKEYMEEKGIQ